MLLVGASSCFAFFPHEVALLVNPLSTMDTDNNGVSDWRDIVLYYKQYHSDWDTTRVCSLKTFDPTPSSEEDIPLSFLHYDIDTTTRYGESASIGKNVNHSYLLQTPCQWMTDNGLWSKVKCWVIVMGLPLRTQHNSLFSAACGGTAYYADSTVIWSLDAFLEVFAHPGMGANGSWSNNWSIEKRWVSSYVRDRAATTDWTFYPGIYYCVEGGNYSANADSVLQWVTTARLDGFSVDDVRGMIRRAATTVGFQNNGSAYVPVGCALVDQDSSGTPYKMPLDAAFTGALTNLQTAYSGGTIYWDAGASGIGGGTGVGGSIPDTIETRWGVAGGRALNEPVQFYFTAGKHNTPQPPTYYWSTLQFPIAAGAIAITPESFACWSFRDTTTRGDNQGMIAEAIHAGFTYGVGSVCEPTTAMIPKPVNLLKGLSFGYMDIARAGQMCINNNSMKLAVFVGDPLGNIGRSNIAPTSTTSGSARRSGWTGW